MGKLKLLAPVLVWGLLAAPAYAAWMKAETAQFVVYGDAPEGVLRDYARRLTVFDVVLRTLHERPPAQPRRKLEVYLVGGVEGIRRVRPGADQRIGGVYIAAPQATFALAKERGGGRDDVLFHEYAHHFMLENFPAAYPAWFVEGWAEYYMTAEVSGRDVRIGGYNPGRAYVVLNSRWLPMEDVIGKAVWEIPPNKRGLYYGQAWLLTHFMKSTGERAAWLNRITRDIAAGAPPVKAFRDTTGWDMDQLTRELKRYTRLQRLGVQVNEAALPPVTVTRLPPAMGDLMLDRLRISVSSPRQPDPALLADVRRRVARYPGDPFAEVTLALAEYTWGDVVAGEAIVNRLLAAAPQDREALYLAGYGQILAGQRDPSRRLERFRAARANLAKAYQLDKTDYRPIYAYAYSRTVEPNFPTDNDVNAALEASALAPSLGDAALLAGQALVRRDRVADARKVLARVANNPHGGRLAVQARAMMAGKSEAAAEAEAAAAPDEDEVPPQPEEPTPDGKSPAPAGA